MLNGVQLGIPLEDDPAEACSPRMPRIPVIFFGGNFESMGGAAHQARDFFIPVIEANPKLRFQVFNAAYRGYTPNRGFTRQRAIGADADDLLQAVLQMTGEEKVIVIGASMGAAAAAQLAASRPQQVAGLLVAAPWSSLWRMTLIIRIPWSYALAPWLFWISDHFDSCKAVGSLPTQGMPFAVLSPEEDNLIPPLQHRQVFDSGRAEVKWWLPAPGARHAQVRQQANASTRQISDWIEASWPQPTRPYSELCTPRKLPEWAPVKCHSDTNPGPGR